MVLAAIGCGFGAGFLDPQQALCTKPLGAGNPTQDFKPPRFVVFDCWGDQLEVVKSSEIYFASHAEVCTSCVLTTSWQPGMFLVRTQE